MWWAVSAGEVVAKPWALRWSRWVIRATGAAYAGKVASLQTLYVVVGYPRAAAVPDGLATGYCTATFSGSPW